MTLSFGAFTGVFVVLLGQFEAQDGSPPPLTFAVFAIVVPFAAACGVTGITKLTGLPVARPAAIVQVTTWPVLPQPLGIAPSVSVEAIVSVTVVTSVVAAVPVFVTCSV